LLPAAFSCCRCGSVSEQKCHTRRTTCVSCVQGEGASELEEVEQELAADMGRSTRGGSKDNGGVIGGSHGSHITRARIAYRCCVQMSRGRRGRGEGRRECGVDK
jgi:hypothetical protein